MSLEQEQKISPAPAGRVLPLPKNHFKHAIAAGRQQVGLWCSLPSAYAAEMVAPTGFDWLLLDTEHTPSSVTKVMSQLQAVAPYAVSPAVRATINDTAQIKQLLDVGAQTLFIPYVQSAAEAQAAVLAMRYPPEGVRGVAGMTRASRFGRVENYFQTAAQELCLIVQVETQAALDQLEEIAKVDGVDGIFIGPSDLSASLGYPGDQAHPVVKKTIEDTIRRVRACGKPAGILTNDKAFARRCIEVGTVFTAVGVDVALLVRGAEALAREFQAR
jgi:4-hydroxy-2-oxoheptanedioate aldolase